MSLEWRVAIRYFRAAGLQSVLMVAGVAVGVTVFVFIASLIGGLQEQIIQNTIGSISQVTLEARDKPPRTPQQLRTPVHPGMQYVTRIEKYGVLEARISNWQPVIHQLDGDPALTAVAPTVLGAGFATRGQLTEPITFHGIEPSRENGIIDLRKDMVAGSLNVSGQHCVIGTELADNLGVGVGDKVITLSSKNRRMTFTVAGIFDAGIVDVNQRSFYVSLSNAQRILNLVGYISAVETKLRNIFDANSVADHLAASTGLKTRSWMRQNAQLLSALQAQSGSSAMIEAFTMLSVAFGIASVLVVSVVQRSREIGILRSMGIRGRSVTLIFLYQGIVVGVVGSIVGSIAGTLLIFGLLRLPGNTASGSHLFPAQWQFAYVAQASITAIVVCIGAGIAPARRAAALDPTEVIRYG